MEDVQPAVAQVPASADYPPTGYGEFNAVSADGSAYTAADPATSEAPGGRAYATDGSSYANANAYSEDPNSATEGAHVNSAYHSAVGENAVSHEYTTGESAQAVGYASADSASAAIVENGSALNEAGGAAVDQQFGDVPVMSTEEDRLWGLVRANCLDFNAWTALIQETEKENNILKIQKVYDSFLAEFPLCYGYWKKYADHEGRLDTVDKVWEVYERAVLAVTYSVDIWVHYCQFAISTHGDPENIRRLFERGLAYVGSDYLSSPLWDEYISYEYALQEWSRVAMIYTRILENPIQQLDRYFNSFKEFAASHSLSEIQTAEDSAMLAASAETTDQGVEGEVRPGVGEETSNSVSAGITEAEEFEKYMAIWEEMYKKAKELDSKIINFETAIRRPYFHVRPLDDPELENWHNYLDFIEHGDDFNKVVKLYERCLIACANYTEYWIRYVLCMEASGSMELANNALARSTQVFVKKQPDIHLFAARFKENSGDVLGARAEYQLLYSEHSTSFLEAVIRHANMENRLGNKDAAFSVFEDAIAAEQAKEFSRVLPLMFVQYSRFSFLVAGNADKAREILTGALERLQLSKPLFEAVIHLESILPSPKRIDYLDSLVEKFISPSVDNSSMPSTSDREDISSIFLEFLDLFGDSQSIKKAENRHSMLFLRHRSTLASRKRHAEDYLGSEKTKMSKGYTSDPSSGQSVMGAYPNAQNQWPATYGQNPPAWPQVPQVQGQQWNPGYAPQAGYTGYGGYGTYANPQVPASGPQTAAYGTYPSTSPAQAYPQQTYTQPSAAYPQQQAPATQAYYSGSYY